MALHRLVWSLIIILSLGGCKSVQKQTLDSSEIHIQHSWDDYNLIETRHHPVRTIRLTIHVFQDSSGKGNFQLFDPIGQPLEDWYWINGLFEDASKKMGELAAMTMNSSSPFIKDSRIRYQVTKIHDWQEQELFDLSSVAFQVGNRFFEYVMSKDEVEYKENSLHIFLAGGINKDNNKIASRGIASGIADKRWTVLYNYYDQYRNQKNFWPAGLVSHEIGHNLGLRHTWNQEDGCTDTPLNPYHVKGDPKNFQCWNDNSPQGFRCDEKSECSNNMMDYNAQQNSLTQCQIQKIHFNINQNIGSLRDILEFGNSSDSLYISGNTVCKNEDLYQLENSPLGNKIEWFVSPRAAAKISAGVGNRCLLNVTEAYHGKAILTFRIYHENKIEEIDRTLRLRFKKTS